MLSRAGRVAISATAVLEERADRRRSANVQGSFSCRPFYASPVFPRLLNAEAIKDTIARGVENGTLAYVGKTASGKYQPFAFKQAVNPSDIECSDDVFVVTAETAQAYLEHAKQDGSPRAPSVPGSPGAADGSGTPISAPSPPTGGGGTSRQTGSGPSQPTATPTKITGIKWSGSVPPQKWMNFYTKVLSRFAATSGLKLTIQVEIKPPDGVSRPSLDETRSALRELGLDDQIVEE